MIVVIVVAVLAAIALPQFLNHRSRAWQSLAENDVHHAILTERLHATENGGFTSAIPDLADYGFIVSAGVDFWIDGSTNATRFQVHAQHCDGGGQFRFV